MFLLCFLVFFCCTQRLHAQVESLKQHVAQLEEALSKLQGGQDAADTLRASAVSCSLAALRFVGFVVLIVTFHVAQRFDLVLFRFSNAV